MSWVELANVIAAMAVSTALNGLWLGMLLASLAAGLIRLLPRSNATTRHTIWLTALILAVIAPLVLLIPRPVPEAAAASSAALAPAPVTIPVTGHWPLYASIIWLAVATILIARIAWSIAHIIGLKRRAAVLGQRGRIRILASNEAQVPMAAGFLRRAIIFPQAILDDLSAQEFEQVLCHEMAHLHRADDWTQLVQTVAQAVLFFNPAIYWMGRRLKIEREMACDDWVVITTGAPRPYAACLTHLHELTRRAPAPQLAPGATTRKRWQLSARVEALLETDRNATPHFSRSGWLTACALVSAAFMIGAWTVPPVAAGQLPLATLSLSRISTPSAPVISLVPKKFTAPAPRMVSNRLAKLDLPAPPALITATPVVLVNAWQLELTPRYIVIAVFYIEPPPPHRLTGI